MAKVLGIGGVFFKAAERQAVLDWYAKVLGFEVSKWGGAMFTPPADGVTQQWSVHEATTDYYDPSTQPFMVNLRVDDMDGILEQVRSAGVEPLGRDDGEYGRFAWLLDPAGVKIELWQAPPDEA